MSTKTDETKVTLDDRKAFEQVRPEVEALFDADLKPLVGVTAWEASKVVLAAVTKAEGAVDSLVESVVGFSPKTFKRLRRLARAARFAALVERRSQHELQAKIEEARELRRTLAEATGPLVTAGLIPADAVDFAAAVSTDSLLAQLVGFADALGQYWPDVADATPVTKADIRRASKLRDAILDPKPAPEPVVPYRARLMSLLGEEYSELRAAVQYARRFDGDADAIAPTLWVNRPRAAKATAKVAEADATPTATVASVTPISSVSPSPVNDNDDTSPDAPDWHADAHADDDVPAAVNDGG